MSASDNEWETADRRYQLHHNACAICRAAGTSPGRTERCPVGLELWQAYQDAGDPPHFTWLNTKDASRWKPRTDQ